jgi:hypothetical protein
MLLLVIASLFIPEAIPWPYPLMGLLQEGKVFAMTD